MEEVVVTTSGYYGNIRVQKIPLSMYLYTMAELREGGYTLAELLECKKINYYNHSIFQPTAFKQGGFTAAEMREAGFQPRALKGGFTAAEMREAGYTVRQCAEGGYTEQEVTAAGGSPVYPNYGWYWVQSSPAYWKWK